MTIDQLIAEVKAAPTREKAFAILMETLKSEINDASLGNRPPPSVQAKYDDVFGQALGRSNDILHAMHDDKPHLEPLKVTPPSPSDPAGPKGATPAPQVFQDKPKPAQPNQPAHA